MENVAMQIKVLTGETLGKLKGRYTRKVQLEEETKENEVQLHFLRGKMEAYQELRGFIEDFAKATRLEELKSKKLELKLPGKNDEKVSGAMEELNVH